MTRARAAMATTDGRWAMVSTGMTAIVLGARKHGENSAVARVLAPEIRGFSRF